MKKFLLCLSLCLFAGESSANTIIEQIKPGIGYSQFKQWVIENKLVFENFTKDSITVRDVGMHHQESTRINIRFCGGDDYAGRASLITIQEYMKSTTTALSMQRLYIETLGGPFDDKHNLPSAVEIRRSPKDTTDGIAIKSEKDKESWDVGLFTADGTDILLLQTILKKDSICE